MPSAITWEEGPTQLRRGPLSLHAPNPNVTHRFDLLTVQFTAIRDHGVNDVPQAGSLKFRALDEHKVLWERGQNLQAATAGPGCLGPRLSCLQT